MGKLRNVSNKQPAKPQGAPMDKHQAHLHHLAMLAAAHQDQVTTELGIFILSMIIMVGFGAIALVLIFGLGSAPRTSIF
jgi:NO-binding membrane sensor protein with MHYT domain